MLRAGVARDTAAVRHLVTFLVVTVATVLLTRGFLALAGYPQVGGAGLHVAHVLWGGLLLAVAVVVLLSYVGPAVRSLGAVLAGVGFGLFVDEIGKFVTADNDYFYGPTAALIYAVLVVLVLLVEAMHGRRRHHRAEYLAVAADRAAAGLAGGLTDAGRAEVLVLLQRGGDEPGAAELRRLVDAIPHDDVTVPDPVRGLVLRADRWLRAAVRLRWAGVVVVAAVLAVAAASAAVGVRSLVDGPVWLGGVVLLGVATTAACCAVGSVRALRGGRGSDAAAWVRRGVLVSLLVTQPLVFGVLQWTATAGLLVDLAVFALLDVALRDGAQHDARARRD
ncbi:hypothetical protein DNL40_14085 [Xylanimonas oleitrophica]|uniref:Uncharacterized protein n=1 Tax=Xylanimonas oleitrophica TaxID=2607479 RepID=A0A2W5WUS2_9MICO|nr:hypothetical protein DNL40_14085 [Xylanimonas oleitrophica]